MKSNTRKSRLNFSGKYGYHLNRKGAGWSGPCNPGGVSPSMHNDRSCVTGSIFTGPGLPTMSQSQIGFREPNCDIVGVPASSGSIQSLEETKAHRLAPFPISLIATHIAGLAGRTRA